MEKLLSGKKIPAATGVYFFKNSGGKIIYIGKAANLRSRVGSYFNKNASLNTAKSAMLEKAVEIDWQICDSEIEALVLEARLIKQHRPKYNVLMKDDKNYFFVGVTKEEWPRIFLTHQPRQALKTNGYKPSSRARAEGLKVPSMSEGLKADFIGPFTDGGAIKAALKILRKILPFKTCKNSAAKPCFYHHLSLCPAHSREPAARKKYLTDLKMLTSILKGGRKSVLANLKGQMKKRALKKEFEKAAELRDLLRNLENVFKHRRVIADWTRKAIQAQDEYPVLERELKELIGAKPEVRRVECFDISNISGQNATGSMVVFSSQGGENFISKQSEYRKFKIKTILNKSDDPAMMAEVLERRLKHSEWPLPQLIILDGGKGQLSAGLKILKKLKLSIPICALAKKEEELYLPERKNPIRLKSFSSELGFLFQRIRDEAHRFAISYHHALRSRAFDGSTGSPSKP